jgi:Protein of unknown function (DUF3168)
VIDLEAILSRVLRTDPDVVALVDDRVWLSRPKDPTFPAIFIGRVAGAAPLPYNGGPLYDEGDFDLHCYGGSRVEALAIAHGAVAALAAARRSVSITPWNLLHLPDPELPKHGGRDRERYISTIHAFATNQAVTP